MPLYEFRRRQCGERFEKLVRSSSEPGYPKCPQCGTRAVERHQHWAGMGSMYQFFEWTEPLAGSRVKGS